VRTIARDEKREVKEEMKVKLLAELNLSRYTVNMPRDIVDSL
jgi:hypothetical protein